MTQYPASLVNEPSHVISGGSVDHLLAATMQTVSPMRDQDQCAMRESAEDECTSPSSTVEKSSVASQKQRFLELETPLGAQSYTRQGFRLQAEDCGGGD